jgi:alpha-L-fucosidase
VIPQPSVERMAEIGRWMRVNSEAVNGAAPSPFPYELPWGLITTKPGKMYLHVFNWPKKELVLYGLKSRVSKASLLATKAPLKIRQKNDSDLDALQIELPASAPDRNDSIVALDISGPLKVDTSLQQQPDGVVTLAAHLGVVHNAAGRGMQLDSRGVVERWTRKDDWIDWDFKVTRPGKFQVVLVTSEQKYGKGWEGGQQVSISAADQQIIAILENQGKEENPSDAYWPYVVTKTGRLNLGKSGRYHLALKAESMPAKQKFGITLVSVRLIPVP